MNAIKLAAIADSYMDVTRNARFQRVEYDNAFNSVIRNFIDSIMGTVEVPISNFQQNQVFQDDLYTLQRTISAAPTLDVAAYPTDYRTLDSIFATIGGVRYYCRPTTQNKLGPLLIDSFRKPSDTKPYYLQNTSGFTIYHGIGTITSVEINYIKQPQSFTIGKQNQLIEAGTPLTNGLAYIAVNPSVQGAFFYDIGDEFTSAGTVLTSGTVIPAVFTSTTDLPEKVHDQIAKMAASVMSGNISDFNRSAFAEKEAAKS